MAFDDYLNQEIAKTNLRIEEMLYSDDENMNEVMRWVLAEKGKQLRPRFLIASASLKSKSIDVTEYAAMVEILHTATLVHDDVIDDSPMRRGRESVYKKFGTKLAVYAGDYMLFSVFGKTKIEPSLAHRRMYKALVSVCQGELGQNASLSDLNVTEDRYLKNINGKTAALFRLACELGGSASGMREKYIGKISRFGECYGMMFQICDDLLDYGFGVTQIGKPTNIDIVDGVYTLPLIYAMEDSGISSRVQQLIEETKNKRLSESNGDVLRTILIESGSLQRCKDKANEFYVSARECLDGFGHSEAFDYLSGMLENLNAKIVSFN